MADPCPKHCDHIVGHLNVRHGPFAPEGEVIEPQSAFRCCACGRYNSYGRDLQPGEIIFTSPPTKGAA